MHANKLNSTAGISLISAVAGVWLIFSTTGQAVSPAPDGGYPNNNTAEGTDALFSLTIGTDNTAVGFEALYQDTAGYNTAIGSYALTHNTDGDENVALGSLALLNNTTGYENTAVGHASQEINSTGYENTAIGAFSLSGNTNGTLNTAMGAFALYQNTTGINNTGIGVSTLYQIGTGSNNIAIGSAAGNSIVNGSNNIDIGNAGLSNDSGTIRIGTKGTQMKTFIAGIYGATTSGGVAVYVNSSGKVGTTTSSARFKEKIRDMGDASDVLLSLRPVAFRYKPEIDPQSMPQFGLVAEEVEKIDPDLVVRDSDGKPYTVRYDAVNAMLLNEFLKAHRKIEEQDRQLQKQQKQIDALTAGLQKVNDKVELSKLAPQVVENQ
jgi:hypothetical protein